MASKHGITLPNTPGTIDSDYRGPLGVSLINLGTEPYTVRHGDRVAQVVVAPVVQAGFDLLEMHIISMSLEEIFLELTRDEPSLPEPEDDEPVDDVDVA